MSDRIILCGTDNPQAGTALYFIGYTDLVDGYRHAWVETGPTGRQEMRRGRDFGHPADPRCPECQTRVTTPEQGKSS